VEEVTLTQLDVAVVALPYEVVVVVETSYGVAELVETWEAVEVHIVQGVLLPRDVSAQVDTWRVPLLGAVIHAKDCSARQRAMVEGDQRSQLVVVERVGDNSRCIGGWMR
jgi:hypothetical protein